MAARNEIITTGQSYSVPSATCPPGTRLEARGDQQLVKLYKKGELVKVHPRQQRGARATDAEDYPQEKTALRPACARPGRPAGRDAGSERRGLRHEALRGPAPLGEATRGHEARLPGERYGGERLDAACARALAYDLVDVRRLQRILLRALDAEPPATSAAAEAAPPLGSRFARPPEAFDHRQQRLAEAMG
ncbi:hypothetical protein [Candidatus Amarobacter glycogenicus]|uniref:hypothetical protein n=1 Tax=Candidatus Amarobacter glycogenicus TaxID=3140699 RepID=UPI002A15E21C|nr:hypothetical protein [Dehalococcoidia bacterium]